MTSWFVSRDLSHRDFALDALKGALIIGMIMVNHPPPDVPTYAAFAHAAWHGWTLADTIFPGFLFAVGVSVQLSLRHLAGPTQGPRSGIYRRLLRRFALLMLLNFLLINFPYYFAGTVYFTGTLALIAWCHLLTALIYLNFGWRTQSGLVLVLLGLQWAILASLPVPGHGIGQMTPEGNSAAYVDRVLLTPLFGSSRFADMRFVFLPTLGAVATTMIGLLAGQWLRGTSGKLSGVGSLAAAGLTMYLLGNAWGILLPVNKQLWTGSYVLVMAGMAAVLLATIMWITEKLGYRAWAKPFEIAGMNALFFYVLAQSLQRLLVYGRVHSAGGTPVRLRTLIYQECFAPWFPGQVGALAYTFVFLAFCYIAVYFLYRRRILLKI